MIFLRTPRNFYSHIHNLEKFTYHCKYSFVTKYKDERKHNYSLFLTESLINLDNLSLLKYLMNLNKKIGRKGMKINSISLSIRVN